MSVTTNTLGTNTTLITLSGETSSANFITALDAAIVGAGWTQYDISNQYYRVYRSANVDGSTYKIFAVQIDPVGLRIWTTSFETWDPVGHTGTNEVWTYNRAGVMGYAMSYCDIVVMASARWCVLQTFIRNQPSVWSGVFELTRDAQEDTAGAGYPCWCWTSSACIFAQPAGAASAATVSLPRTRGGLTGQAAAVNNSLTTSVARIGYTSGVAPAQSPNVLPSISTNPWNTAKKIVQTARVMVNNSEAHGRVMGLKLAYNIGSPYNVTSMLVDSQYNYSATGTAQNFWVLSGNPTTSGANPIFQGTGAGYISISTVAVSGGGRYSVSVGQGFYVSTPTGVVYIDASGASLATPTAISGITQDTMHLVYDNVQYVYAATTAGLARIDTLNGNAVTFVTGTSTLSLNYLSWDGTYVWAIGRSSVTNQPVYKIDPVGQTATTYNCTNVTAGVAQTIITDGTNTYVFVYGAIYKFTQSGTVSLFANTGNLNYYSVGLFYNGQTISASLFYGNNLYVYQYTMTGSTAFPLVAPSAVTATSSASIYVRAECCKVGIYDVATLWTGYNTVFYAHLGGLANSPTGSTANLPWYQFVCNGNYAYGCTYSAGGFSYITNLFRPDELTTTFGRILLPQ